MSFGVLDATAAVRVPEPGTVALPVPALAGLAAWRVRRAMGRARDPA